MDSSEQLYLLIFNLPQQHSEIKTFLLLTQSIGQIITLIKSLKAQNRIQDIEKKCYKNQKLIYLSKLLKQYYFKVNELVQSVQYDDPNSKYGTDIALIKKQTSQFPTTLTIGRSRLIIPQGQYRLKIFLISMFYHMLVNDKMLIFIHSMHISLYVYIILLRSFTMFKQTCLRYKQTEKCLKFIYQFIKISKENIPKIYIHLIKNMLELYNKNYENGINEIKVEKKQRIKLGYSYIFQTSILILKKNLFLAAKCGILALLFHKCIEGSLTIHKVEIITQIIINYCIEEKSRSIIHNTIDLGKTFALFTNVDMVESAHEKISHLSKSKNEYGINNSKMKNIEAIYSCALMIEMYLSNWCTIVYFLQQNNTLTNFIVSLKRKSEEELKILNEIVFMKIIKRCINFNRKKILKSNNIFNIQSNYLVLKSLLILNYLYKQSQFKQLIYGNSLIEFKQSFIEILLEFFINKEQQSKNKQIDKLLINSIKNISYYKQVNINIETNKVKDSQLVNNNIESYYQDTLLPFEFNLSELKHYLVKIIDIIENQSNKEKISMLLSQISTQKRKNDKLQPSELLAFYKIGVECTLQIRWFDKYLDISKYLSNILWHLRQIQSKSDKTTQLTKPMIELAQDKDKLQSEKMNDISQSCRQYIKRIFEQPQDKYFQFLKINLLDDIGRYFYSDNKIIQYLKTFIRDINQAYKISRILLHIDNQRSNNQSTEGPEKIYSEICKHGSKALILQIIQIIKYSCEQNDNRFLNEHLQTIFSLIYDNDEDIVYSIIELLEEFVNKSKELKQYILKIDIKKINKYWNKRVLYLLLHYEIDLKQSTIFLFLKDELQKWEGGQNRKRIYYNFVHKQLKKFTQESILTSDYLNLNLDPSNYHKLIFLPWNIKINDNYYPIFIQYKNLQDKLKLKIYVNLVIKKQIVIQELYIGSHNYTTYIQRKSVFGNKQNDLKIKLTLEEIKKQYQIKGKESNKFVVTKEESIFFINEEDNSFIIQRININIPLTLDTYRPLTHPYNFINLLGRTKFGYEFLKNQKFIEHCLQIIKNDLNSLNSKEDLKGALICIGTLSSSQQMQKSEKNQIYELINKKLISAKNYQIQEICLWVLNILIKDNVIRNRIKSNLVLIETKKCGWVCIPDTSFFQRQAYLLKDRINSNLKYIRENLPQKLDNEIYKYLCAILNGQTKEDQFQVEFEQSRIDSKLLENLIKYFSIIDFEPAKIYQILHKLSYYLVSQKFDLDYPNAILLP